MNNYIAAVLVLVILLFFPLQYGLQMKNHYQTTAFDTIVEAAKEEAKQEGYFTPDIIAKMKSDITAVYQDMEEGDVVIHVTTTPKYRLNEFDTRELITYEIGVPVKKITAANQLWGISDEDNQTMHYLRGTVASEKLLPGETS